MPPDESELRLAIVTMMLRPFRWLRTITRVPAGSDRCAAEILTRLRAVCAQLPSVLEEALPHSANACWKPAKQIATNKPTVWILISLIVTLPAISVNASIQGSKWGVIVQ